MNDAQVQVFFYTLLLIVYLSIIETLFCRREIEFNRGLTSFGFAQNTIHDFRNRVLNS